MNSKANLKTAAASAVLALVLAACGGQGNPAPKPPLPLPGGGNPTPSPNPGQGGFSGTMLPPQGGGGVAGTLVIACFLEGEGCNETKSKVVQADAGGAFNMGAQAGTYLVVAWKDVNNNQDIDDGDIIGGVLNAARDDFARLSPPKSGLQVFTVVYQDGGGSGGGSLAGSVSLATGGGSVGGSVVVACFLSNGECEPDSPNTRSANVSGSGARGGFSLSVGGGSYGVFAFKDVNGDGSLGAGDLFGCYSANGNDCLAVTPPKTDMSLIMTPLSSANSPETRPLGGLSPQTLRPGFTPQAAKRLLEGWPQRR